MSDEKNEKQLILGTSEIQNLPDDPNDRLIMLAIQGNLDVDKLEQLIALKNREEERKAKQEFDRRFAEMQQEFEPVSRTKEVDNKYKYAPVEALQKQYGPIISKHGFSYRWSEESVEDKLRVWLHISGYGHTESNYKDLPHYDPDSTSSGKRIMNPLQAEGTRSTYGRRYTFIAGFGLIIEDEDTDGSFDEGVAYADYIRKLDEATDAQELHRIGVEMYRQLKKEGDHKGAEIIAKATTRRKSKLGGDK